LRVIGERRSLFVIVGKSKVVDDEGLGRRARCRGNDKLDGACRPSVEKRAIPSPKKRKRSVGKWRFSEGTLRNEEKETRCTYLPEKGRERAFHLVTSSRDDALEARRFDRELLANAA
jgi:hypothetical protein